MEVEMASCEEAGFPGQMKFLIVPVTLPIAT